MVAMKGTSETDPKTYKHAMKQIDKKQGLETCVAIVASLQENKVYTIVDRPEDKIIVTSKWVFKKKIGLSGKVEKYKARLVARGFMQEEGTNYGETYSPTVRQESIRLLLAMATSEGMHMEQMDVTTAFLYADLVEEVYLEIPEGMFLDMEGLEGKCLRLWKALYGLKQIPHMWNLHVDKALAEFGMVRLSADFLCLCRSSRKGTSPHGRVRRRHVHPRTHHGQHQQAQVSLAE